MLELIKVALGQADGLSHGLSVEEWDRLFETVRRQSLVGVCFSGVERLPGEQMPPKPLLMRWYGLTTRIESRNRLLDARCGELYRRLRHDGFMACVLKGQGVAGFYPQPLRRQSGDIDVWVRTGDGDLAADRQKCIGYVKRLTGEAKARYHHVEFDVFDDVEVELHFMPTWLNCPLTNRRLQRWFEEVKAEQFSHRVGEYSVPTDKFNAVYLLLHISKHILEEGIGLRQLMDYYFLLAREDFRMDGQEVRTLFDRLGLRPTARAVMYVMKTVFGLPDERLLCEPDEKLGAFLIEEMMVAGNFGWYDPRLRNLHSEGVGRLFCRKQKRGWRFFRLNAGEVVWSPLFAIYQRIWRYHNGVL